MTVTEAIDKGINLICKPTWNPYARLELTKTPDGMQAPWARLYDIDPAKQVSAKRVYADEVPIRTIDILLSHVDDKKGDWEEWISPTTHPAPSSQ